MMHKRKLRRSTALILALPLAFLVSARAADYYVDYANGSDSSTGLSQSQAWKRSPGDRNATGRPASTSLAPGDTVNFRRGVTYVGILEVNWSGSSGNPITYDGESWGTGGRAVISNRNGANASAFSTLDKARNWLVFKGLDIYDMGGIPDNASLWSTPDPSNPNNALKSVSGGCGLFLDGGGTDIQIRDCLFREIGQWIGKKPIAGGTQITGVGISLEDNARVLISGCEFTRMQLGISVKARSLISDVVIRDCDLHGYLTWPIDISPRSRGAKLRNISIVGTSIHDYHEYDLGNWAAWGEKPHTDGIFVRTAGMDSTWENVLIDRCYFYADDKGSSRGGTASIYISQGPSITVRNSIFTGTRHNVGDVAVGHPSAVAQKQVVNIYNNTFYGTTRPMSVAGEESRTRREVSIVNNLIYRRTSNGAHSHIYCPELGVIKELDYNQYFSDVPEAKMNVLTTGTYFTLATLRGRGYEKNGFWGDPHFLDTSSPLSSAASLNDLRLGERSPAIAMGKNLSSLFTHDFSGHERGASRWVIGAHANIVGGGATPPARPTNLRIVSW